MAIIGFNKIWDDHNGETFDYKALIDNSKNYIGLTLIWNSFFLQALNCAMITTILVQI